MDKYEYKLRAEEIVRLAGKKQYQTAAKIADEIRWEKVRNIQMLCTVSEVYAKIGKYDDSKDVLLLAYNRSPNSKMIVYRLVELSIELKDYQEATDFYHEYVQLAPNDSNSLLLKYRLYKGRGAKLETLIAILEEFKTKDYQEEWILELAKLYHQAKDRAKCVDTCNEIDLWFNTGESVIQALEIKRLYEPLTPMQERKLQNRETYGRDVSTTVEREKPKNKSEEPKQQPREEEPSAEEFYEEAVSRLGGELEKGQAQETVEAKPQERRKETVADRKEKGPVLEEAKTHAVAGEEHSTTPRDETAYEETVAETLINLARPESEKELKRGFSILPKTDVVSGKAEEFAFDLPKYVEEVKLEVKEALEKEAAVEPEDTQGLELLQKEDEPGEIEETKDAQEEEAQKQKQGILGKMFSKLMIEDDELDEDFEDDYIDDDPEEEEPEDEMVTRGLTGQYEKIVIDEEEDENDPLNVRIGVSEEEEEGEYEYLYADEDEQEEYDALDEDEEEPEETVSRSNKRFNFFRNTMEDDEIFEDDDLEDSEESQESQEEVIPLSYAAKYDTLNLQKELAKSIQQLMDATEKETVDSTLENVKKMVEESHIPELTETMRIRAVRGSMLSNFARKQAQKLEQAKDIEEVISDHAATADWEESSAPAEDATVMKADFRPKPATELAIKLKPVEEEQKLSLDQILTQENDGQLSLLMPEEEEPEEQIDGQLNIEDVLREWEKQELLSENDKEKKALEEARKKALEETQAIMSEIMGLLKDVIPKFGSIKDGEEKMSILAESLERVQRSLPYTQGIVEAAEESKEAASAIEAACAEAVLELENMENDQRAKEEGPSEEEQQSIEEVAAASEEEEDTPMPNLREAFREMEAALQEETETADETEKALQNMFRDMPLQRGNLEPADAVQTDHPEEETLYGDELPVEDGYLQEPSQEVSQELMPEMQENLEAVSEAVERASDQMEGSIRKTEKHPALNEEQEDILSYFLKIGQLKPVLEDIVFRTEYAPEHMIITGEAGSGKTSLAMRIIKAAQVNQEEKIETIAKIKATLLNQKNVNDILEKVNGGVLIVEQAGSLKPATVYAIEDALYSNKYYVQLVFVDKKGAIGKLLTTTSSFINDIQMCIDLPIYTDNELEQFAKTYAQINGYELDGMAVLALHSVIDLLQTDKHSANLEDVKNIMDDAMERADKRSRKLLGKLFGKKADNIVLLESDFE